jgi:hypothetical protein
MMAGMLGLHCAAVKSKEFALDLDLNPDSVTY